MVFPLRCIVQDGKLDEAIESLLPLEKKSRVVGYFSSCSCLCVCVCVSVFPNLPLYLYACAFLASSAPTHSPRTDLRCPLFACFFFFGCRAQAADMKSTSRILVHVVTMCFEHQAWDKMLEAIVMLIKRRGQIKKVAFLNCTCVHGCVRERERERERERVCVCV